MPLYSKLFGTRTYLCGAMDRVSDGGVFWREKLTPFLNSLGVIVFNPCDKPIDIGCESQELREHRRVCKENGDLQALRDAKEIRSTDLRMVDISDFLIVNIDTECHACGTYEELFLANRQKKPVLIHCEQGIQGINPCYLALARYARLSSEFTQRNHRR
jgi:nucleoside 2-deoxyribosyltransferase